MRFRHRFGGHNWKLVSAVFNKPIGLPYFPSGPDQEQAAWGFTEVLEQCECGARRNSRAIGDHTSIKSAAELADLERLMR
jgi:hypothetical protein